MTQTLSDAIAQFIKAEISDSLYESDFFIKQNLKVVGVERREQLFRFNEWLCERWWGVTYDETIKGFGEVESSVDVAIAFIQFDQNIVAVGWPLYEVTDFQAYLMSNLYAQQAEDAAS